jgi:Ino eighty subunit 1
VDIQFDFLKAIFDNEMEVFTNSYDPDLPKQNFADLYIDTMARSTKTSKVLRDKLLSDREAAKGMAMVCLLVNVGRMNTTLNCMCFLDAHLRVSNVDSFP